MNATYCYPALSVFQGDCLSVLQKIPDNSINCCVTSPPYWGLRDYGVEGQIGLEKTPDEYVAKMVAVFEEVRRVLRDDGTCWVNLGDSYAGGGNYRGCDESTLTSKQRSNRGAHGELAIGRTGELPPTLRAIKDGTLKPKDLCGIPWRVALALQADSWYLRSDIIWHKPNPMPESVTDRPTKAHEYLFLLSKSERYWYDAEAIRETQSPGTFERFGNGKAPRKVTAKAFASEAGEVLSNSDYKQACPDAILPDGCRNKRSVWTVPTSPYSEAHFATFPPDLIKPCILAGCPVGGTVLDPFGGSGTTGQVALELGRKAILIELNPKYIELIRDRTNVTAGLALA